MQSAMQDFKEYREDNWKKCIITEGEKNKAFCNNIEVYELHDKELKSKLSRKHR